MKAKNPKLSDEDIAIVFYMRTRTVPDDVQVAVAQLLSCNCFSMLPYSRGDVDLHRAEIVLKRVAQLDGLTPQQIGEIADRMSYVIPESEVSS